MKNADTLARLIFVAVLVLLLFPEAAGAASEISDLEEGLPLEIADAYPIPYRGREFQMMTRYERSERDHDGLVLEPRVELGIVRNAQLTVAGPFLFGEGVDDGPGDAKLELLYDLNQEQLALPAFALAGGAEFPTGDESRGVDPFAKLLVTKTLPGTWHLHRLHANVRYGYNAEDRTAERSHRYKVVFGYSVILTNEILGLLDVSREEGRDSSIEVNVVEAGARLQVTPRTNLSFGAGAGFADESPDARATLGLQVQF